MSPYERNDVPHVDPLELIRSRPGRFFASGVFDPVEMALHVVLEALHRGNHEVSINIAGGWTIVSSRVDWIDPLVGRRVFSEIVHVPGRTNEFYCEIAISVFATAGWTADHQGLLVVAGQEPPDWQSFCPIHLGRVVAFR
jgi:hypothetical protein